jgi:hypothetical protein
MVLQQLGSYLGHSGRGAHPFGKAAREPICDIDDARRPQGYLRNSGRVGGLIVYVLFRTKGDSKWAKRFSLHSLP